jgi:phosphoribosyl-ATP pyrophosphohydrolase
MTRFVLHDIAATIKARADAGGEGSYTRKLLDRGAAFCARKLGEEAIETVIAGVEGNRENLAAESADLLYHLLVLLQASGISLEEVEAVLEARAGISGLDEKAARGR